MAWYLQLEGDTYEEANNSFSWNEVPDDYNIAVDCLRKHDDPKSRIALYQGYTGGQRETYTFHEIDVLSNQLANSLEALEVERGDRVAIIDSQRYTTLVSHLACWKLGAISVPLSPLFGNQSLEYRLTHSSAKIVVADAGAREKLATVRSSCPGLQDVAWIGAESTGDDYSFEELISGSSRRFDPVNTDVDTPAIILYTSGSTGTPKGTVHSHGVWLGHCPAFSMYFERDVFNSIYWTPADWAWVGALGSLIFPAWHYGQPVVGYFGGKFDAKTAFKVLSEYDVTDAFIPPTAVRMLMSAELSPEDHDLDIETIVSGSEPLTPEIIQWVDRTLQNVVINEGYGQTEASVLATNCHDWFELRPGSMGKPVVGFDIEIIDPETGDVLPRGEIGEVAVRRTAPVGLFKEYWNDPEQTAATRVGNWHSTGDLAKRDESGYLWFKGRSDDLIITSGYRVAPNEVEGVLLEHPAIDEIGVVGVPDETRGQVIKAVVKTTTSAGQSDSLREELRDLVRDELAEYAYPRIVEFVPELSRTETGKLDRDALREERSSANG